MTFSRVIRQSDLRFDQNMFVLKCWSKNKTLNIILYIILFCDLKVEPLKGCLITIIGHFKIGTLFNHQRRAERMRCDPVWITHGRNITSQNSFITSN